MGAHWRILVVLLSVAISGSSAFVMNVRLGRVTGLGRPESSSTVPCTMRYGTSTASRAPLKSLAPGGKVGKQKVSLERAVTSIAKPKSESKKEEETKQATKTKRATQLEDAPMYKLILIGDEEYNREHVVLSIQDIVPDTDNTRAAEIFEEAQEAGKALCGVFPEEQAELYVEQFTRCEPMIFADMEKDDVLRPNGAGS